MAKSVFVVMPIGSQSFGDLVVTEAELRSRYDHLIREAILKAAPGLDVMRADDVAAMGAITTDILTRIMHADIVVADVTYPNPNVFYELGLRHASRNGTIIIRDREGPRTPFDIAHLRHIEYENTPAGLKALSERLRPTIAHLDRNPDSPDSSFQEIAKLTDFEFPNYRDDSEDESEVMTGAILAMMSSPELMDMMMRSGRGEEVDQLEMFKLLGKNPDIAGTLLNALQKTGQLDFGSSDPSPRTLPRDRPRPKSTKGRKRKGKG